MVPKLTVTQLAAVHRRWLSQSATAQDDNKLSKGPCKGGAAGSEKDGEVVYDGPFSCTINFVKILCLIHFGITVSLSPHLAFAMSPDMNVVLKGAVPSLFILFGAYTTIYYHWTRSPYIHKLRWKPGSDSFDVEIDDILAGITYSNYICSYQTS